MKDDTTAAEFTTMWENGAAKTEIAERLGMTTKGVDYWRRKLNLPARSSHRPMPDGFIEFASAPGVSVKQIIRQFRCHSDVANRWLSEAGITLGPRLKPVPDDWHQRVGTMSAIKLATHYGVANTVVKRWLRETNTKPAKPQPRIFKLPGLVMQPKPIVQRSEIEDAAHYLRRFYANVFRCDIKYDERRTWGFVHGVPNGGRGFYHVDRLGILANNDVIELAKKKGWSHAELDS